MVDHIAEELKHVEQHEIMERRRGTLHLIAFAGVMLLVIVGLILAFSSIGATVR